MMLAALATQVQRLYLLTDAIPEGLQGTSNLRIIPLGRRGFRRRARAWLDAHADELDVVHDTFGHLAGWFQARGPVPGRRFRLITTQYTTNWGWFARVRQGMALSPHYVSQRTVTLWRDRRVCRAADRVLVLGPGHEADLTEGHGVPAERIEWVPSEIDTERFSPPPKPRPPGARVLFTGTVFRNKGIDVLLDAMTAIAPRWPGMSVSLVGKVVPWLEGWLRAAGEAAPFSVEVHS